MPLLEENDFIPDLNKIPQEVAEKSKLMFLNYPNNPTGALATKEFFKEAVEFAKKNDIIICHDAAYSEIAFDGVIPISFLEVEGAKEVGIEFNSLSKPFNMTGWRIAWAVGRKDVIEALGRIKSNIDSGVFQAVQYAAIEALKNPEESVEKMKKIYKDRRDVVVKGLNSMGWNLEMPKGSFYVWAPVPKGYTSSEFAELVLEKAGVIVTPGNGYGKHGEGYFRIALTVEKERAQEALNRMQETIGNVEF
jgi:LL-diaminopimelate aminotransferase